MREVRKLYKQGLAKQARSYAEKGFPSDQMECLRCLLIKRGNQLIADSIITLAKISIPDGVTELEDKIEKGDLLDNANCDYLEILALSTAIGNDRVNPPIAKNSPPLTLIRERRIHLPKNAEAVSEAHKCLPTTFLKDSLRDDALIKIKGSPFGQPKHAVIYAPPGFGKTTLQLKLAQQGIMILDTDDIPFMSRERVKDFLKWTSIMTNQLDLLDPNEPTVAFVPKSKEVLIKKVKDIMELNDDDGEYWFKVHDFSNFTKVIVCKVEYRHISQWIELGGEERERFPVDTEFIEMFKGALKGGTLEKKEQ